MILDWAIISDVLLLALFFFSSSSFFSRSAHFLCAAQAAANTLKINPEGTVLASAGDDKCLFFWNVQGECENFAMARGHKVGDESLFSYACMYVCMYVCVYPCRYR